MATEDDDDDEEEYTISSDKDDNNIAVVDEDVTSGTQEQPPVKMLDQGSTLGLEMVKRESPRTSNTPSQPSRLHDDSPRVRSRLSAMSPYSA